MDKYKVMLYPKAYRDIEDIYEYIAITKEAPQNAKGQTDRIWDAIKALEEHPQQYSWGFYHIFSVIHRRCNRVSPNPIGKATAMDIRNKTNPFPA